MSCWGKDGYRQAWIPSGIQAVAVQSGEMGTCALLVNGGVQCWTPGGVNPVPPGLKWR